MAEINVASLTSKKVAGIPVIFLVLGVAVIALYGALRLKPSASLDEEIPVDDVAGDGDVDTSQPVFAATPVIYQPSGVQTSVSSTPGPDSDDLWKRRAIDWLRQNGYTLDVATAAINKYLAGEMLSTTEAQARDAAVRQFGLPPEDVPSTSTEPKPTPTTPNYNGPAARQGTPPCRHIVKGTSDDSYGELAMIYYGHTGEGQIRLLKSYNPGVPAPFPKGKSIQIPRLVDPKYYTATSATRTASAIAQKNGTTAARVKNLNPEKNFPVRAGVRVRVR